MSTWDFENDVKACFHVCVCVACPCAWKNGSLPIFFDCFHVCVVRIGLRDVSVVHETEWLLERFFTHYGHYAQQTAPFITLSWFDFFDMKANI